jgi:ABC-type uncharacterized transport system auxiliary subunit
MKRISRAVVAALIVLTLAACGSSSASVPPSVVPSLAPATFDEFSTQMCGAFTSLFRAIGNPDANTPSVMSKVLDDAVKAGDGPAADIAAAPMMAELESARVQAAAAARWQPTAATMVQMDRLIVAFEALTKAKQTLAHTPGSPEPFKAFEAAGGREAWAAVVDGVGSMSVPAGASPQPCRAFSGQP